MLLILYKAKNLQKTKKNKIPKCITRFGKKNHQCSDNYNVTNRLLKMYLGKAKKKMIVTYQWSNSQPNSSALHTFKLALIVEHKSSSKKLKLTFSCNKVVYSLPDKIGSGTCFTHQFPTFPVVIPSSELRKQTCARRFQDFLHSLIPTRFETQDHTFPLGRRYSI